MDLSSAFNDLHEIREAIRAMKPFEAEIRAISDGGIVYQIHSKRAVEHGDCPECLSKSLPGGEAFSIETEPTRELLTWDVAWAIAAVNDGRASYVLPEAFTRLLLNRTRRLRLNIWIMLIRVFLAL